MKTASYLLNSARAVRRLLLVVTFFTLHSSLFTLHAQTIGEAFYIYRNDGQINGFVRSDIDSITYSYYSVDSVRYDEIVTQIVYTNDSIFRIPLSSVDSVSFVTPKTTYQPGVVNLSDELMPYIVSCDSLTLTFSSTTPVEKLPKVGDKLVTTEMNDIFPIGFAGMVTAVHGNSVVCSRVALEDVFETYYNVASVYGYVEDGQAARHRAFGIEPIDTTVNKDFQIHTITIPLNSEISRAVKPNSDLALKGGGMVVLFFFPLLAAVCMVGSTALVLTATIGHLRLAARTTHTDCTSVRPCSLKLCHSAATSNPCALCASNRACTLS